MIENFLFSLSLVSKLKISLSLSAKLINNVLEFMVQSSLKIEINISCFRIYHLVHSKYITNHRYSRPGQPLMEELHLRATRFHS